MFNKVDSNRNRNKVFIILGVICLVMVIGVSFALWQLTFTQTGTNVITTGCLQLKFTEDTDAINLTDATPTSDEEGKGFTPFTFTIENVCTTETSYVVNLETVSSGDKILADNYIKANLTDGTNEVFSDKLLDSHENLEKVISEANKAYKLYQGKLGNKEKVSFNLRVWLDENTEAIDSVMDALWQGKITVTATYVPPVSMKNVMKAMSVEAHLAEWSDSQGYAYNTIYNNGEKYVAQLSKVVFESKINPYSDAVEVVDFSEAQDSSVLGYYVRTPDETAEDRYTLYIQANGKIKVNPIASYYGYVQDGTYNTIPWTIEGTENLDTSLVTDMSNMFSNAVDITSLKLDTFDTSKVTKMPAMFNECSNLTSLDVSNFDTSQVTDMTSMFGGCSNLTSLDISSFNTSKVTKMPAMFKECSSLERLDLSSFDTSNVTNIYYMFSGSEKLNVIVYGNNFIHKTDANIVGMYVNCPANKPTDSSWNGLI